MNWFCCSDENRVELNGIKIKQCHERMATNLFSLHMKKAEKKERKE